MGREICFMNMILGNFDLFNFKISSFWREKLTAEQQAPFMHRLALDIGAAYADLADMDYIFMDGKTQNALAVLIDAETGNVDYDAEISQLNFENFIFTPEYHRRDE